MNRLQKEREARGLSKLRLSQLARVTPSTVGWAEASRFLPYPPQLARLADALGIPASEADTLLDEVGVDDDDSKR